MSLVDDLLIVLTSYHGGYKLIRRRLMAPTLPQRSSGRRINIKDHTVRITLSRLRKRGLVENNNRIWSITAAGREYLKNRLQQKIPNHSEYPTSFKKRTKNMVIAFDIPEVYRKKRDWLRIELVNLGFAPLQKSVWFGPAPLPEEFVQLLGRLELIKFMKFFEATEKDLI